MICLGYWIWPIAKGGWNWIRDALKHRKRHVPYAYGVNKFPRKLDFLVFYDDRKFYGRIVVDGDGRQITPKDTKNYPQLGGTNWKNIMFLDATSLRIFDNPASIEEVSDRIKALKGKSGKSLIGAIAVYPEISKDEYKIIVEKGFQNILKEFLPL